MPTANSRPIAILMYHQIDTPPMRGTPFRGLTVAPQTFARHMGWLKMLGWQGLAMRDLMPYLSGERQGKVFGLTFDDGFANVHRHALPVLNRLGFTATNYFVAAQAGQSNHWDSAKGVPAAPLMTESQMADWVAGGHEVGSHTLDHTDLVHLEAHEARHQIHQSRERLEALCGSRVTAFCYPYGHYRAEHAAMVREAGYLSATTTDRGRIHAGTDWLELPRVAVTRTTHFPAMLQKLLTRYEDRRRAA